MCTDFSIPSTQNIWNLIQSTWQIKTRLLGKFNQINKTTGQRFSHLNMDWVHDSSSVSQCFPKHVRKPMQNLNFLAETI